MELKVVSEGSRAKTMQIAASIMKYSISSMRSRNTCLKVYLFSKSRKVWVFSNRKNFPQRDSYTFCNFNIIISNYLFFSIFYLNWGFALGSSTTPLLLLFRLKLTAVKLCYFGSIEGSMCSILLFLLFYNLLNSMPSSIRLSL